MFAKLFALGLSVIACSCGARTGVLGSETSAAGAGGSGGSGGSGGAPGEQPQAKADKIDLLFVIDDSGSMADKQQILSVALPDLVERITNPRCVTADGRAAPAQPKNSTEPCGPGATREFNSVQDMHIGVVSSNLGAHGSSSGCGSGSRSLGDAAHLVERGARGNTYQNLGFLAWDPAKTKKPAGQTDPDKLAAAVRDLVGGVGEAGCGLEAPLEAWYRFLVEPTPHAELVLEPCAGGISDRCSVPRGVDEVVLRQRRDFLRPDSLVAIILLSDENDCSIVDQGFGHRIADQAAMPRATSQCATDPRGRCCRSCADSTKPNCPSVAIDPECRKGPYTSEEDGYYLRCFDQKRRFGMDLLYPVKRYIDGLTARQIMDRSGVMTNNPLLVSAEGVERSPTLVFFAGIIGVPWQDIAQDSTSSTELAYKSATLLHDQDVWALILGDPSRGTPPLDPLMIESIAERRGRNPITGAELAPSTATDPLANPINGHEASLTAGGIDLQYACIFELEKARDCNASGGYCDCGAFAFGGNKPICQDARGRYGSTQFRAKAYPGSRQLEVLKGFGKNAIVASICARNVSDASRGDYGYRPALGALLDRLGAGLL